MRGEVQSGSAGRDVGLLQLDVQGGRQVLGQGPGAAAGEIARLPGDDVDLAERRDGAGLGGGGQGGGQPLQGSGQSLQAGAMQIPGVLPLGLGLGEIGLIRTGAVGGLRGPAQLAGDLLEGRGEETEVPALLPGGNELDGGLQALQEVAAQELIGAGGAVDSGHAVTQGALGAETLGQARGRVVGQDGPAGKAGASGRLRVVGAQEQGVLVGEIPQNDAGCGGLRGGTDRGAGAGLGGGVGGGGGGGGSIHLAHAQGRTCRAHGVPGSRARVLRVDRRTLGRPSADRAGDGRRGNVRTTGPGVLLVGNGRGCGGVSVRSVRGVRGHDNRPFASLTAWRAGPAATLPSHQSARNRVRGP